MLTVLFAVLATLLCGFALRTAETFLALKKAPPPPAIEPIDKSCRLWEVRHTQMKMLDAGIITDEEMSICDNENCQDCQATKRTVLHNKEVALQRNAIKSQNEYRKQRELNARYRQVGDTSVAIPDNVPSYAHLETRYDPYYMADQAFWTWTDPVTGKTNAVKSHYLSGEALTISGSFTRSNAERERRREEKKRRTQLGYM